MTDLYWVFYGTSAVMMTGLCCYAAIVTPIYYTWARAIRSRLWWACVASMLVFVTISQARP